jgi:hypothetical protein
MSSFSRLATVACSTKRVPAITGGKRGEAATHLSGLTCTPLDPVDPEVVRRLNLNTAHELLQCYITGTPDILEGDSLVVSGKAYPIRSCAEWKWRSEVYLHLILEDLKK